MAATLARRIAVIALLLAAAGVSSQESVPIVYEDNYITVHAGLPESGARAVHLGDLLSLVIEVVFDARRIQIEILDDDVFQRAFSGMPAIRLYAPAIVTTRKESGDRVRVTTYWRLQVLGCPDALTSCPGSRSYELPVMTVAYQLIDDAGNSADSRAARFRPWPGKIDVAPAIAVIPGSGTTLTDILPGGAYDSPQPIAELAPARSMLLAAGALLLLTGFLASAGERRPQPLAARSRDSNNRWQQTLARLEDDTMPDDEWSDLLRRCITWYCLDEFGRNPYAWLGAEASDTASGAETPEGARKFFFDAWGAKAGDAASSAETPEDAREFFLDVLQQASIDPSRRADYLDRLLGVTGHIRHAATVEQQV